MKYDIAVCSMFRDSQKWQGHDINQVHKFFGQMYGQKGLDDLKIGYFLIEGNSNDDTLDVLKNYAQHNPNIHIFKKDIEGSSVASVESDIRFKNLSLLGNTILNAAKEQANDVFWIESDFSFSDNLINKLLHNLLFSYVNTFSISPVPYFGTELKQAFYDTYAFKTIGGNKLSNSDIAYFKDKLIIAMQSIGSCALLNGSYLRSLNADFREGCFPALCKIGYDAGKRILVDTTLEIYHPSGKLVNSRLI